MWENRDGTDLPLVEKCEKALQRRKRSWQVDTTNSFRDTPQLENASLESDKQHHQIAGGAELVKNRQGTTFLSNVEGGNQKSPGCG